MKLELEELANTFAQQFNIQLTPRPLEDTICSYWMTGNNGDFTLEHNFYEQHEQTGEEVKLTKKVQAGCNKEEWSASIVRWHSGTTLTISYHGPDAHAAENQQRLQQARTKILENFCNAMMLELTHATDPKCQQRERDMLKGSKVPIEEILGACLYVDYDNHDGNITLEHFKALPEFIKAFYECKVTNTQPIPCMKDHTPPDYKLQLGGLVREAAKEFGIRLKPKHDRGSVYYMTGRKKAHRITHSLFILEKDATERVHIDLRRDGKECWEAWVMLDRKIGMVCCVDYTFLNRRAERYRKNIKRLCATKKLPWYIGNALLEVLESARGDDAVSDYFKTGLRFSLGELRHFPVNTILAVYRG